MTAPLPAERDVFERWLAGQLAPGHNSAADHALIEAATAQFDAAPDRLWHLLYITTSPAHNKYDVDSNGVVTRLIPPPPPPPEKEYLAWLDSLLAQDDCAIDHDEVVKQSRIEFPGLSDNTIHRWLTNACSKNGPCRLIDCEDRNGAKRIYIGNVRRPRPRRSGGGAATVEATA